MEPDYLALMIGEKDSKKIEEFNKALLAIEDRHIDFFKSRPAKYETEKHDRLKNHCAIWDNGNRITFGFEEDTDIPHCIIKECFVLFDQIFNEARN
jgi:hypothetical protein